MAQHGAPGKHSANNTSPDKSSQETKKIDRASADETKAMPKAAAPKSGADPADKTVKFNAAPAKTVSSGAAEAEAAQGKKKNAVIAAVIAIIVIIIAIVAFMFMNSNQGVQNNVDDLDIVDVEAVPVDNPIDFAALQAQNPDVYAYMSVPNTNIDLPILFNAEQDNYYLVHDIDGNSTIVGAIYSQSMNTQDFTDPVTVLYGHTLINDTMFSQLHKFEDPEFFEANPYFNVYLPNEILTYEVLSAFEYDNRHIMNTYDFTNTDQQQEFFNAVQGSGDFTKGLFRETTPLQVGEDNILVLSTCTVPSNDNARFLVVGRLVSTQTAVPMQVAAEAPADEAAAE